MTFASLFKKGGDFLRGLKSFAERKWQPQRLVGVQLKSTRDFFSPQHVIKFSDCVLGDDRRVLAFTDEIADKLSDAFRPSVDAGRGLVGDTLVSSSFHAVRCVAGRSPDIVEAPVVDNADRCRVEGVRTSLYDWEVQYYQLGVDMFHKYAVVPQAFSFKRVSNSGPPAMVANEALRLREVDWFVRNQVYLVHKLAGNSADLKELFEVCGALYMSAGFSRTQWFNMKRESDGRFTFKSRPRISSAEARSLLWKPANNYDFTLPFSSDHFARRFRLVKGANAIINLGEMIYAKCCREGAYAEYAPTLSHKTPQETEWHFAGCVHFVCLDVFAYDQHGSKEAEVTQLAMTEPYISDEWATVLARMAGKPTFAGRNGEEGVHDPIYGNDPFDATRLDIRNEGSYFSGLSSGDGITSNHSRQRIPGALGSALHEAGIVSNREECDQLYRGRSEIRAYVNGDNVVVGFPASRKADYERFKQIRGTYVIFAPEAVAKAGGKLITLEGAKVKLLPDLVSYVANSFASERGIGGKQVADFVAGIRDRKEIYGQHPLFPELSQIVENAFAKHFGYYRFELLDAVPGIFERYTEVDRRFMEEPDRIHYSIDEGDVDPALLKRYFGHVTRADVEPFINTVFKRRPPNKEDVYGH